VSGAIITLLLALFCLNRRRHKRALSSNESVNLDDKTFSEPLAENSTDSIGFLSNSSSLSQAIVDANETGLVIEADALVADGTQAAGDISPPDIAHASEAELEASASKPLEMDLRSISLDFESAPQLTAADINAAPIPDAFNGDFSNLLKINVKPKSDKVSQPSTVSKSLGKPIRSSKTKINTLNLEESSEVATKLELAAAYIDMEDKKGALALLREAINEGGPEQRARAQDLIDRLT
jgi:pilus assembly protein FimV